MKYEFAPRASAVGESLLAYLLMRREWKMDDYLSAVKWTGFAKKKEKRGRRQGS
jgi:hypothetical protein